MKPVIALLGAAALALALAGCGPARPMTESEFKGFCYQYPGSRHQGCETIGPCDEYTPVMSRQHASLQACVEDCNSMYEDQYKRRGFTACQGASENARDWCQRYCRSAYAK